MSKRGDRASRPTSTTDWSIRFDSREAADTWDSLLGTHANALARFWDEVTREPRQKSERLHQLKADFAFRVRAGVSLEQWQYEFSGAGRIWYCIDDSSRCVWLTAVQAGHPGATATRQRRKRG